MKHFIGVHTLQAKPMTLSEFCTLKNNPLADNTLDQEGYFVVYPNGYESWSPKAMFETGYMELTEPTKISEQDLDKFIGTGAMSALMIDDKTTLVRMNPRTGFVMYETSSCVDPANYNHEMGINICIGRLRNKLWPMLGFLLQWGRFGLRSFEEPGNIPEEAEQAVPPSVGKDVSV